MKRVVLTAAVVIGLAPAAWAQEALYEKANSPEYKQKFVGMIGRGIVNVATCPIDLLVNTVNETKSGPPLIGTLAGVAKGAGCTTLRALSGAVDLLTFWAPNFNGIPVSYSYENCLAPEGREAAMMTHAEPAPAPVASPGWFGTPAPEPKPAKKTYTK